MQYIFHRGEWKSISLSLLSIFMWFSLDLSFKIIILKYSILIQFLEATRKLSDLAASGRNLYTKSLIWECPIWLFIVFFSQDSWTNLLILIFYIFENKVLVGQLGWVSPLHTVPSEQIQGRDGGPPIVPTTAFWPTIHRPSDFLSVHPACKHGHQGVSQEASRRVVGGGPNCRFIGQCSNYSN